jgi:hypothetical protein
MGTERTAWHFFFTILLRERGPRWLDVRDEVPLSDERPRVDYLLLRKHPAPEGEDGGATLRGLWPLLARVTIAELKSIGRPYRPGNLDRLWGYVHAYYAAERERIEQRHDLRAALIVPSRTPSLDADVDAMALGWNELGGGYWEVSGGLFRLFVVEVDTVAEREDDDLLRLFGHHTEHTIEARRFWAEQVGSKEAGVNVQELEGYDDVWSKILDKAPPKVRLAVRLAGLEGEGHDEEWRQIVEQAPADVRLAGLDPEQAVLALPDAILRGFSDAYLATLSDATQAQIRARLGR